MSRRDSTARTPGPFDPRMLGLVLIGYGAFAALVSQFGMPALFVEAVEEHPASGRSVVSITEPVSPVEPVGAVAGAAREAGSTDRPQVSVSGIPLNGLLGGTDTSPEFGQSGESAVVLPPITLGALPADVLGVPGPMAAAPEKPTVADSTPGAVPVETKQSTATPSGAFDIGNEPDRSVPVGRQVVALLAAADAGDLASVAALLRDGANANALSGDGDSALMRAAWQGHDDVVKALLGAGADAGYRSPRGITPLITAGIRGFDAIAESLLDAGANIDAASNDGRTALMAAVWNGHAGVVRALLERGATVTATDRLGRSALHYAAAARRAEIAADLLTAGADPDQRDHSGSTGSELAQARGWTLGEAVR